MFKNKINQYFVTEFFNIFIITTLSLTILIWMTHAARYLDLMTELGNPLDIYIKFTILSLPKVLKNTILLSFLISIFFLFSKLENDNELNLFLISGISKTKLIKLTFFFTFFIFLFYFILSTFAAPATSAYARSLLSKAKFSLINTLIKEKNFNSPLQGLTVYVEKNDQNGNLEGILIYEKNRTIIAKSGKVLSDGDKTYLELYDGNTQEKNNDNIVFITFDKTFFDFTKYNAHNLNVPKIAERNLLWLKREIKNNNNNEKKKREVLEEINQRLIKPFFIFILTILGCFFLYSNKEKLNLKKLRYFIFILSIALLILNEILITISSKSYLHTFFYIAILLFIFILAFFILSSLIKMENNQNS